MSIDPISLTFAITAIIISVVGHVKLSKCSDCMEIQMKDDVNDKRIESIIAKVLKANDQNTIMKLEEAV